MIVYHGTTSKFDRFDLTHLGEGEGKLKFGVGHYASSVYDKAAPLERNKLIVEECDCVLAFWDGKSRGTKFTLDYAKRLGKLTKIVQI